MGCKDDLKLYICRLKLPGEKEEIRYSLSPDFICEPGEEELFPDEIVVSGSLERIDHEQWFLSLNISTQLRLRCCVCEKKFLYPVKSIEVAHLICFDDAKSGVFDCKDLIRQELLLESDHFQECNKDGCPERENIVQFLKDRQKDKGNSPFDHL
ncbi:hypothetical protein BOKEGFJH_00565 [Chlamydia avium]|uniref:DUF177 domain-containing protein n=2 Tax=Chlamydia avium TaxID=1457141 RepID=W8JGV9_9CHLA|nr:hypothetical protein [Chlamydia avium]AHK63440.1 Uncharacterized protein M832_05770 [Chlamydia avium 10DC88]EPP36976.1 hypothetical protein CP10743SC13_0917 [Chlamydia psittaci 10_743_SC13]EPP38634.1 hypothetical protein CP10881SC42_0013 [Chlamydia avium]VVT43036.1 hypothetical protein BOKEGFJH_00565 [Chlamydia avium]